MPPPPLSSEARLTENKQKDAFKPDGGRWTSSDWLWEEMSELSKTVNLPGEESLSALRKP